MKNFFIIILLSTITLSCNKSVVEPKSESDNQTDSNAQALVTLSDFEKQSLIFMREEEKLARDVYVFLYKKWGTNIFNNISKSEETHTSSVLTLLQKYKITDPVGNNAAGVFFNPTLQTLYNELTLKGSASIAAGLEVGATIEDLDIFDLMEAQKSINNKDISLVYSNLTKGSRNHIRSFTSRLSDYGISYKAQFITDKLLTEILNSPMETGG